MCIDYWYSDIFVCLMIYHQKSIFFLVNSYFLLWWEKIDFQIQEEAFKDNSILEIQRLHITLFSGLEIRECEQKQFSQTVYYTKDYTNSIGFFYCLMFSNKWIGVINVCLTAIRFRILIVWETTYIIENYIFRRRKKIIF